MFSKFSKKTLFSKLISGIVAASFILTSVPVRSYAALGYADKLRAPRADSKHTGNVEKIREELEVLGELVNLNKTAGFNLQINSQTGKLTFSKGSKNEAKWIKLYSDKDIAVSFVSEDLINSLSDKLKNYFGFRDFFAQTDEAAINKLGLRYDITVLPPGKSFGNQLSATKGHEHSTSAEGNTFPEIYEVLYGDALFVQQGINRNGKFEVIVIVAKAGDKVILLPGYSHRTVNVGKTFLVMTDWMSTDVAGKQSIPGSAKVTPNFAKIEEKHGYAYLVEEENGKIVFRPNPSYADTAVSLKINTPVESIPEIGIDNKAPMYGIIHTDKAKALASFLKLAQGRGFENVLSSAYKEINLAEAQKTHNLVVLQDATEATSSIFAREPARPLITPVNKPEIFVLSNQISLLEGAMTRGYNLEHAILDGAEGGVYNHSETRGSLESDISHLIGSLTLSWNERVSLSNIQKEYKDSLKIIANLPEEEIDETFKWLETYLNIRPADPALAKENLARRIVNKIINTQLKKVIEYSNNYTFKQTVLCIGETRKQRDAGVKRTQEVLRQDLEEILSGISKADAQKIGLRIAYEPRWAINQQPPVTPDAEKEIQPTHRFIKNTLVKLLTVELDVDYGGSLNAKNALSILSLADVDGGLIGGAAKTPEAIGPVIDEAITQGQKKGKVLNIGMNWKAENIKTGLSSLAEFENKVFKTKDLSKVQIAISTPQVPVVKSRMAKLEEKLKAKKVFVEKAKAVSSPIQISGPEDLAPVIASKGIKQGIVAFDWNMPLKDGLVEDNEKLVNSIDTLKWFKESSLQYLYVMTHSGRPSGTGYEESFSLKPIVDEARRLFSEEGMGDIEVILLPYDFVQAKKVIDAKKAETTASGKKVLFALENVRMYPGEQSKDPAIREQFEREIIALTGEKTDKLVYLVEAFEKAHRGEEASMEMGFLLFPREHIAAGINVVETVKVVSQFLSRVNKRFSVIAGGKKFDKLKNIADLGKLIGKSGGELFIVGALADPLLANAGINVGKSLMPNKDKSEEIKGFKDGQKKLTENVRDNKLRFSLPVDFVVKDGKKVKELLDAEDMQVDIGPKTIKMIVDHINSLGAGEGLLLNGGTGVFDADWGSQEGTIAIVTAANEAAKRGVAVLFGGGDMVNAVNMVVKETGLKLDPSISVSTAGGALFVAISKGIGGGLIPIRAVMKFKGETTERLLKIYSAVNEVFPEAMVLPATRTPYIDTSVKGDDATREPALDLSRGPDGYRIAIPTGRRVDDLKNFYETTWLPFIVTAEDIAHMPNEIKDAFFAAKKEKDVSAFTQKLMRQALINKGIPVQDWQERSHQLDQGKLGEAGVDVSSIIGIRTRQNDLMVWMPILVKRGEDTAHLALGQKIAEGTAQNQAKAAEVSFSLPKDINITDNKSAFDALKTYNPLFFDALQKGDLSSVNILINIVNKLEPKAMVDPAASGIEFNKELGVFTSLKDTDEKATAPGFGKNLERFRGGLYSVGETCARLYHLATPNYDAQGKVSVVVKNKELQDAVIAFYARMQRHLLETAIQYFNDARIFESLRVEIGDYAQRLNKAVKESDALELSRANAEDIINHLTAKGVTLSSAEKANIESFMQDTDSAGLFDVLQLAALLRVDTFTQGFRHLKLDYPRKVLASDKPFEAYDGSGRIARTQFAQRLATDINADEKGYIGRYMVASQALKGKTSKEKSNAAMQKAAEMLTDRQIEDAKIVVQVGQESVFLTNLIKSNRITFHAGEEVLTAQLDFQDTDQIPSVYPVHINLDGRLIGVVYCVDMAEFTSGLKTALQARERKLDNIPRPFIVRGENNEEIFFGLRVDATPGGVEIGDQELEVAGAKGTVKLSGDTLWKLFAKFNLPEPRGDKLTAADELARIRQIYNQVKETRMPPEGGKQIVYAKAQIPATLLLPGFNSLGRHLGWAIPFVGGADVMYVTPGSCSTNGASHAISALSALAGAVDSVGPTFHMYTSSDKIVEKNPSGHTSLKSTGAAKGVVLLLSLGEDGQTFFTAIRTPTGLIKGKADIVGGSMFDLLVRLPNNIPDELIVRYLSRISAEFPQDLKLFDSKGGSYTWKETIAGQKTGSILYADFIERVAPNIYRLKVGYDNEMSFGSKENAMHEGIYLDALRNRQTAKMEELFSKALANTSEKLSIAKITPSQITPLLDINAIISRVSQFNVSEAAISGFVNDETVSFDATGGKEFSRLVDSAKIAQDKLEVSAKQLSQSVVQVDWQFKGAKAIRNFSIDISADSKEGVFMVDTITKQLNSAIAPVLQKNNLDLTKEEDYKFAMELTAAALKLEEIREITFNFVKDKLLPAMRENLSAKVGIQKSVAKGCALVIDSRSFELVGVTSAIQKITELFDSGYKIGLYGKGAEELKALLGASDNIITADTEEAALSELNRVFGVTSADIVALGDSEFNLELDVNRVVVSRGGATLLAVAKALKELANNPAVDEAFKEFYQSIQDEGVIPEQSGIGKRAMLIKIEGPVTYDLSDIKLTEQKAKQIEKEAEAVKIFILEFAIKD